MYTKQSVRRYSVLFGICSTKAAGKMLSSSVRDTTRTHGYSLANSLSLPFVGLAWALITMYTS